ncbi:transposable element Tc3 transposase [Trichonephila clavipes]|nr:transposable element Tc3 transposase [Trichonephila clavipes]
MAISSIRRALEKNKFKRQNLVVGTVVRWYHQRIKFNILELIVSARGKLPKCAAHLKEYFMAKVRSFYKRSTVPALPQWLFVLLFAAVETVFTLKAFLEKAENTYVLTIKNSSIFENGTYNVANCQVIYSQFGLAIHQNDHQARRRFVEWAQNEIAVVPDFHKRILFSDEAHFWLNGNVNKQNCRIWSEANPQVYVETPLHPEKLTVWCALWAGGIIGPYFFKNDEGHNVTVNGDRYRAMITNFFIPELNNHDVKELRFQKDGATCHTARATIDLLKDTLGDRLILRFGPVNWPPRSCDLTPLDYFLWGYVKSLVYVDKPQTLDHLEDNIRRFIADIRPQMLEKVFENWTSRLDYIRASRGNPMPEITFKI